MANRVHLNGPHQVQHIPRVHPGRFQQLLAQAAAQFRQPLVQPQPRLAQHCPDQAIAVRVQPRRGQGQHHIPSHYPLRAQDLVGLDHPSGGAGQVVLIGGQQARMLGGLTAQQRRPSRGAGGRDPGDDRRDPLRD